MISASVRGNVSATQADKAASLLRTRGLMRATELKASGVSAATLSRMTETGLVVRLGRGLYQLADAPLEEQHTVAEAAKRIPRGVVCLVSALSFHGLTDRLPRRVWMAIGRKDWAPKIDTPPVRLVRFADALLAGDIEHHVVEGADVKVFSLVRTLVDLFRHERSIGVAVAIKGLREALRRRLCNPVEVAEKARQLGAWTKVRPYLETLTADA